MTEPVARDLTLAVAFIVLGAVGTYLLLPHRHGTVKPRQIHWLGAGLAGLAILLLALFWKPPGTVLQGLFFYVFGLAALTGGILMISARNPIYSALWFASVVLSTCGLFLLAGAPFLAAGTVIVYAGAIIVTFLFVIMLAQSTGQATYDRMARSPARATLTSFLLLWALVYSLLSLRTPDPLHPDRDRLPRPAAQLAADPDAVDPATADVLALSNRETAQLPTVQADPQHGLPAPHVAGLGGTLFTDHLLSVELAGTLLFVALIGALVIATPRPPIRPGDRRPAAPAPETATLK